MKITPTVQLPTGINNLTPTVQLPTVEKTKLTKQEVLGCDVALSDYQDLMSPRFKNWYCKVFYILGRELFAAIAAEARADGKDPAKLFSIKLKQAIIKNKAERREVLPRP